MNRRAAAAFLGRLVLILAAAQLLPLLVSILYRERPASVAFLISAAITAALGLALVLGGRQQGELYHRDGILIVVGGWALASLCGALPYLLSGTFTAPMDALFESASGFTTTGASVMVDIETVARGVLFWRGMTQWLGGMGIVVLFVALLPELGPGARFLYRLEVPGPAAASLAPRIRDTAAALWKIYALFTVAETTALMLAGLDLFDAITHTFTTLSTGGFSPRNASVGAFDSVAVEVIVILFMTVAGANFALYHGVRRRGWKVLLRDAEFRIYVGLLAGAIIVVSWDLLAQAHYRNPARAILDAAFQVVSINTTTGFATADFDGWPHLSRLALLVLMFIGGCAGSTAGAIKVMRVAIGWKTAWREVRLTFSPASVRRIFVGGTVIPDQVAGSVVAFGLLYVACWGTGALLLSLTGSDLVTAASASAATLGNIGPGLADVGPTANYAFFTGFDKGVMVLLMWLGRLELYSVFALFARAFWRP